MKKSILALGAAAVVGGLGFAGSAHAIAYFGPAAVSPVGTTSAPATDLRLNPGGTGHYLYVPYYSAQGSTHTLLNITNTDLQNGKAVKIRFRGAANSDDVLDFTLFLSPGDVWAAGLEINADGVGQINTTDTSCTVIPRPNVAAGDPPRVVTTGRLAPYVSNDNRKLHANEGYIEILNMADVPPNRITTDKAGTALAGALGGANPLYTAIKHVVNGKGNWVPPCTWTAIQPAAGTFRTDGNIDSEVASANAGLSAPTGQLMATWGVMNNDQLAVYGGTANAVQAVTAAGANGYGMVAYAPQVPELSAMDPMDTLATTRVVGQFTADPLLRYGVIPTMWFDLPDMSTPLLDPAVAGSILSGSTTASLDLPLRQAAALSDAISIKSFVNDYAVNIPGVPTATDWVVAQPTRRYFASVFYGASVANAAIVWNQNVTNVAGIATGWSLTPPANSANRYSMLRLEQRGVAGATGTEMGPYACMDASLFVSNREEAGGMVADSPGNPLTLCGEVYTLTFGGPSLLNSKVAVTPIPANKLLRTNSDSEYGFQNSNAGWARLTVAGATSAAIPSVGFAATSFKDLTRNGNLGQTIPHRW